MKPPVTLTVTIKVDDEATVVPDVSKLLGQLEGTGFEQAMSGATLTLGFWNEGRAAAVREALEEALADRPITVDVETKLTSKRAGARRIAEVEARTVEPLTPLEKAALDAARADDDALRIVALLRDEGPLLELAIRERLDLSPARFVAAMDALAEAGIAGPTDAAEGGDDLIYALNATAAWAESAHPLAQQLRADDERDAALAAADLPERIMRLLWVGGEQDVATLRLGLSVNGHRPDTEAVEAALHGLFLEGRAGESQEAGTDRPEGVPHYAAIEPPPAAEVPAAEVTEPLPFDAEAEVAQTALEGIEVEGVVIRPTFGARRARG